MGATARFPVDVLALQHEAVGIALETTTGLLRAYHAILATGYERRPPVSSPAFDLHASYAMATPPGTAPPVARQRADLASLGKLYLH